MFFYTKNVFAVYDRQCQCGREDCSLDYVDMTCLVQVMSHNKERRSKRDEKLDKKSQAMEELKAEREKKKNRTGDFTVDEYLLVLYICCLIKKYL